MHKLCYLILLHFVIKSALGENGHPRSKESIISEIEEIGNLVSIDEQIHALTMEEIMTLRFQLMDDFIELLTKDNERNSDKMKVLAKGTDINAHNVNVLANKIEKIEERMNLLVKENEIMVKNMLAKENEKIVESMTVLMQENVKMFHNMMDKENEIILENMNSLIKENEKMLMNVLAKENQKIVHNVNGLANENVDTSQNGGEVSIKDPVNTMNANPLNCMETTKLAYPSGLYGIQVEKYGSETFNVYCENKLFGGGWTVVARRMNGSVDFADRYWTEYKEGFGDLSGEFFIGMDKLYALTNGQHTQELIFVLRNSDKLQVHAKYSKFAIGDESEDYFIKTLGDYSGDAGDAFSYHRNQTFKTKDTIDDCSYNGAWWYTSCFESNLFGSFTEGSYAKYQSSIEYAWPTWRYNEREYLLKSMQMMIRPKST